MIRMRLTLITSSLEAGTNLFRCVCTPKKNKIKCFLEWQKITYVAKKTVLYIHIFLPFLHCQKWKESRINSCVKKRKQPQLINNKANRKQNHKSSNQILWYKILSSTFWQLLLICPSSHRVSFLGSTRWRGR